MAAEISTFETLKDAVARAIVNMNLPGLPTEHVVTGKIARDRADILPSLPGVLIANWGNKAYDPSAGSNLREEIPYQLLVAALQASNQDNKELADRISYWTERIGSRFREQKEATVAAALPGLITCHVTQDVTFDPSMFANNADANVLVLKFVIWEGRG